MATVNIDTVLLSELVKDYTVYPRKDVFWQNVESLAEALRAGATLPPIIVCRKTMRIVDGFHRHDAYTKVNGGNNIEVPVEFRDYADDSEFFLDAIRLNSGHGQKLSTFDIVRSTKRAEELGITRDVVADVAGWTLDRLEKSLVSRTTAEGDAVKRTNEHLAGKTLTEKQAAYNQYAGGMRQSFYIAQVNALIESESIDYENEDVVKELTTLAGLMTTEVVPTLGI